MCGGCTWHCKTFLVQLYWHLAIKLYVVLLRVILKWSTEKVHDCYCSNYKAGPCTNKTHIISVAQLNFLAVCSSLLSGNRFKFCWVFLMHRMCDCDEQDIRKRLVCQTFMGRSSESVRDIQFCPPNLGYFSFAAAYESGIVQVTTEVSASMHFFFSFLLFFPLLFPQSLLHVLSSYSSCPCCFHQSLLSFSVFFCFSILFFLSHSLSFTLSPSSSSNHICHLFF